MNSTPAVNVIGNRYALETPLGAGGMGIVYHALDRLTGQPVALKRLTIPGEHLNFQSRLSYTESGDIRLVLAQEFKMLASLRHPHIISVLDYGFDDDLQPYFTMELLEGAVSLLEAGQHQPIAVQIGLLVQVLQAVDYLHRRGVIHRDLKPDNVLVSHQRVKVLDFGLALSTDYVVEAASALTGTLSYMAPEVFVGEPSGEAADLYAIGVMAFELFGGRHPFNLEELDLVEFAHRVQTEIPDLSGADVPPAVAEVVSRLLAKAPQDRYASAKDTIVALSEAAGLEIPAETTAIRESFLQAAEFVGREAQLKSLTGALLLAAHGHGSAWLVGGESGVGKTRLLNELRTRALIRGALVLQGQAEDTSGGAYQPWRPIARWLALLAQPDDLEAGVLQAVVPDIPRLLGRTIPPIPDIAPEAARLRFFSIVSALIQRLKQPTVIILEDLHWASAEALALLEWVVRLAPYQSLLIIASYRDDEKPDLPAAVGAMARIKLDRLSEDEITRLSRSMLGESGTVPDVVALLQRETEGNVFFMVEVARALAEEAGQLADIGRIALPERVATGGIQSIVRRRLDRVAPEDRPLLRLAAVAGRQIDAALLHALDPAQDIERWLTGCAEVSVLDVQDGEWRFAHDKLREGVLADLAPEQHRALHRKIARGLETIYPDITGLAGRLAYHWGRAGDREQEYHYSLMAAQQAARRFANEEAIQYYQAALALTTTRQITILYELARIWQTISQWETAEALARQAIALPATTFEEQKAQAHCHNFLGYIQITYKGDYQQGFASLEAARQAFDSLGEKRGLADVYSALGNALIGQGDYAAGLSYLEQQHAIAVAIGDRSQVSMALRSIGHIYAERAEYDRARSYYARSLEAAQEAGDLVHTAACYSSLGVLLSNRGELIPALDYYRLQLESYQKIGDISRFSESIISIGSLYMMLGDFATALACCEQGLEPCVQMGDQIGVSIGLIYMAECYSGQQRFAAAEQVARLAVAIVRRLKKAYHLTGYLITSAEVALAQQKYDEALLLNQEALDMATRLKSQPFQLTAAVTDTHLRFLLGRLDRASAMGILNEMLERQTAPGDQADLYFALWQIDPDQEQARNSAARLYQDQYARSPLMKYRERYQALCGQDLPEQLQLPPLPDFLRTPRPVDLETLLAEIESGVEKISATAGA